MKLQPTVCTKHIEHRNFKSYIKLNNMELFFYGNRCSMQYIFLATLLIFINISLSNSVNIGNQNVTDCLEFNKCWTCVNQSKCSWSLDKQKCIPTNQIPGNMVVHIETHCPHFSVIQKTAIGNNTYEHKIKVTNDLNGFLTFLKDAKIVCTSNGFQHPGRVIGDDEIGCSPVNRNDLTRSGPGLYHCYVTFDGVILRLDNDSDYYFSYYDNNCGDANEVDRDCVVCTWTSGGLLRHLRRCSAANRCTGLVEWYDARDTGNFSAVSVADGGEAVTVECADARIQSINPQTAPWTGGTSLEVMVAGHQVLMSGDRTMTVTVAGRNCVYPSTQLSNDTIECKVSPSVREDEPAEGPVRVEYGGGPGTMTFAMLSPENFRFVLPEVSDVSPTCGLLEGGTVVTVTGRHLNTGTAVSVFLGGNRTCEPTEKYEDSIKCVTGPVDAPSSGPVIVQFDKWLSREAGGKHFSYTGHPRLANGRRHSGIASGGTRLSVHGAQFACVENASFYVEYDQGRRRYADCKVHSVSSLDCRSPELANVSQFADVPTLFRYGVIVHVAGRELDLQPLPDDQAAFQLYPDPAFRDFETSHGSVVINGASDQSADIGYRIEDVVIRFPENPDVECVVTVASSDRIACMSSAINVVRNVRDIIVTVGDRYVSVVNRKSGTYDGYKLFSAFSGIVILASLALLCVRMLRRVNLGGHRNPLIDMRVSMEQVKTLVT